MAPSRALGAPTTSTPTLHRSMWRFLADAHGADPVHRHWVERRIETIAAGLAVDGLPLTIAVVSGVREADSRPLDLGGRVTPLRVARELHVLLVADHAPRARLEIRTVRAELLATDRAPMIRIGLAGRGGASCGFALHLAARSLVAAGGRRDGFGPLLGGVDLC